MARRSQCSDAGDNPLDPNYLPPHYREEYRLAIDRLVEEDLEGYYKFLQGADVVDFLSLSEIDFIQNSVQLPNQSSHPEHPYLNNGADGSSDTYWPLHSDLDAPGLDLGWPQIHHFIGPAEVTTLVNPAAPDMPSIKEQARRLIKNAQMVIAVVMDMFTDVDIFADILNAAMRNVPVYILLDEANVQHFVNMVNNCRVDLNSIQSLRVRTVSGITYHCRTGKSFKGQMLDRFLLTDCRAVLSGNYSFMWSYEKLHRCMAHLFLGQLVSTFDEEFRILYALSEPLIIENLEDLTILQKQPYPSERPMLSDIRKYRSMDPGPPEEWPRQGYDERMEVDRRMMPLKRQETFHGPMDIYGRFQTPQTRLEPPFEQGPPRLPITEGQTHKRHSFAEGAPGRYNLQFQQRVPDVEPQGWPFYRGQKHLQPGPGLGQGPEPDYGVYDKFWNQDFQEQYPEPGFLPEVQPRENFDPVLNYLSSTRNVDIDQSSDKLLPAPDLAFGTGHPRRHGIGQPYACQTSPTPSNTTEKKFLQEHTSDRKDPTVKRGLRNWRISSFLSAYENTEEPEGLPMAPLQTSDPFEEPPYPTLRQTPPLGDIAVSKIPNVREFKVPALPRASQMPAFTKIPSRELPKKPPDEPPPIVVVPETKATPSPSESSSTTDGDKQEEPEQKEPKASALRREESFRRKYNAAVQRSSRLRSSLIFSSLDQENKTAPGEPDEDGTKTESEQTKLPFVSQVLAQRRPATREPFEWRSYIKTNDKTNDDSSKATEKDTESQETVKPQEVAPKVSVPLPHSSEPPLMQLSQFFIDMNDPDQRFLFFKELAAKRKAAEAEKAKLKPENTTSTTVKKDEPEKEETSQKDVAGPFVKKQDTLLTEEAKKTEAKTLDVSGQTNKLDSVVKKEPTSIQSCEKLETKASTDSEKLELKESQASTKKQTQEKQPTQDINLSNPAVKLDKPPVATTQANVEQVTEEKTTPDTTSNELKTSRSVPDFNKQIGLDLRSSHRSSRIYERSASHSQDAPSPGAALKESQQKSRLWTPTLPRREPLKPFVDSKQKCISTVIQIEEPTEERTQTSASDSASTTPTLETVTEEKSGVKSQPKQSPKEDNIVQSTAGLTPSKESVKEHAQAQSLTSIETPAKEKSTVSTPISDKAQSQQPLNEALVQSNVSESSKETTQLPTSVESTAKDKSTVLIFISDNTQPLNEKSLVKSPSGVIQVKEGDKESTQSKPVASAESPVQEKPTVSPLESQSASVEPPSHDKPKPEPKQSHTQTVTEKSTSAVAQAADKSDKLPLTSEKAGPEQSVKESVEETVHITTSSDVQIKENNQETIVEEKTEESKQEATEKSDSKESLTQERSCVLPPTSNKIEEESVSQSAEEAKRKSSIIPAEEVTQLESHSNTSSPTSFATALESISSEETDMLSPGRSDTQHLFRRSESDFHSNVSDTSSDFETPCSDLSRSPMLSMTNIDEAYRVSSDGECTEDNISIAETVIEVAPMDIPASTEYVKADIGSTSPPPTAQKGLTKEADVDTLKSEENQPPQEHSPPETSSNPSVAQSEAKTLTQDASTEPGSPGSDHLTQNETAQSNADVKIDSKPEPPQTKLNKASAESSVPSPVTEKTKPLDKTPETATESSRKEASGPSEKSQTEVGKETDSTDVKTQDLKASNRDSDPKVVSAITQAESNMSSVEASISPATQETKVEDKTLESSTKEASGSTEKSQSEVSKESHSTDVKTQDSESPTCPATSQVTEEKPEADKTPEITTKETSKATDKGDLASQTEVGKETDSTDVKTQDVKASNSDSDTKVVSAITQAESNMSSVVPSISPATQETKVADKTLESNTKEASGSTEKSNIDSPSEVSKESADSAKTSEDKKINATTTGESEIKPESNKTQTESNKASVESQTSPATSQVTQKTKMAEKTPEMTKSSSEKSNIESQSEVSKESHTTSEADNSDSDAKAVPSKTQTESNSAPKDSSATSQVKQEAKISDETPEITAKGTSEPADKRSKDTLHKSKETCSTDTTVNAKDIETATKSVSPDQIRQNKPAEEKAPPPSQPKQSKPVQSRYLSSTANVISSSNLRDDTKILLEQISANSQSRNESNKEVPVTDDEKEDEADKNGKRKTDRLSQQKPIQEREKLLERIQSMRKDKKVYSRFEL